MVGGGAPVGRLPSCAVNIIVSFVLLKNGNVINDCLELEDTLREVGLDRNLLADSRFVGFLFF